MKQLPASYSTPPQYAPAPIRDFGNDAIYRGEAPGRVPPLNGKKVKLESEPDVDGFASVGVAYSSFLSRTPCNYSQGELVFKINPEKEPKASTPTSVCGLGELIRHLQNTKLKNFDLLRLRFIGSFMNNRNTRGAWPMNQASVSTLGTFLIQGCTAVLPYLGKNALANNNLFIAIVPTKTGKKCRYRVIPWASADWNPLDVLDKVRAALRPKTPWKPMQKPAYCVRVGRIRFSEADRFGKENITMDVPAYNVDFLKRENASPIHVSVDSMKLECVVENFKSGARRLLSCSPRLRRMCDNVPGTAFAPVINGSFTTAGREQSRDAGGAAAESEGDSDESEEEFDFVNRGTSEQVLHDLGHPPSEDSESDGDLEGPEASEAHGATGQQHAGRAETTSESSSGSEEESDEDEERTFQDRAQGQIRVDTKMTRALQQADEMAVQHDFVNSEDEAEYGRASAAAKGGDLIALESSQDEEDLLGADEYPFEPPSVERTSTQREATRLRATEGWGEDAEGAARMEVEEDEGAGQRRSSLRRSNKRDVSHVTPRAQRRLPEERVEQDDTLP